MEHLSVWVLAINDVFIQDLMMWEFICFIQSLFWVLCSSAWQKPAWLAHINSNSGHTSTHKSKVCFWLWDCHCYLQRLAMFVWFWDNRNYFSLCSNFILDCCMSFFFPVCRHCFPVLCNFVMLFEAGLLSVLIFSLPFCNCFLSSLGPNWFASYNLKYH